MDSTDLKIINILSEDGLFIFEVSYLKDVIKKLTFDTIYHEHMSYHTLFPLINFFNSVDLKVLDFDLVKAQGGSIRVYVGHKNQKINYKKIQNQIFLEKKMGLFKKNSYLKYYQRIQSHFMMRFQKFWRKSLFFYYFYPPVQVSLQFPNRP